MDVTTDAIKISDSTISVDGIYADETGKKQDTDVQQNKFVVTMRFHEQNVTCAENKWC